MKKRFFLTYMALGFAEIAAFAGEPVIQRTRDDIPSRGIKQTYTLSWDRVANNYSLYRKSIADIIGSEPNTEAVASSLECNFTGIKFECTQKGRTDSPPVSFSLVSDDLSDIASGLEFPPGYLFPQFSLQKTTTSVSVSEHRRWADPNGFVHTDPGEWRTKSFLGQFGSSVEWSFSLSGVSADTAEDAARKIITVLPSLRLQEGPKQEHIFPNSWYCSYEADGWVGGSASYRSE